MTQRIAALFVVGGGFVVQGLLTITGIISARLLGVEGRGELALVVALSAMAAQLTLGGSLPNALTARLAARGLTTRGGVGHLVRPWTVLAVAVALPFGVLFAVLHGEVGDPGVWWLGAAVVALALLNMGYRLVLAGLLGEGAPMPRIALATLLPQTLVTLVMAGMFVVVDRTTPLVLTGVMIGAFSIGMVVSLGLLAARPADADERLDGPDLWRLTRATYVGSIGPIDGLALDRTLVGAIMGTVALGLYSAAAALASLPGMMGTGIAAVLLPRIAAAQADPAQERALVRRWVAGATAVLGALTVVLVLGADWIIVLAFGRAFESAVPVAHWLVAASGLLGLRRVLVAVLQGRDRGAVASRIELALTPVLVVAIVLAARADAVEAVGVAMLVTAIASVTALTVALRLTSPTRRRDVSRAGVAA
ncbi:lipopolysaccharide biosynthesis protein [Aeromicrobium sp. CnD17-E]|uniref:lipopolysaccharide biosynthesis protein n=1 Tax=Aeromicrobium sp. CnD17-E TaxID=2954487 RepID=UPI00209805CC|nr:oligosaccharide flippase family protein [Aeromicrobium sp. CnD17-E]MCO7239611.1 oligosaccharide flippase family protein [Aeromicrobium sp. CnD17-E]